MYRAIAIDGPAASGKSTVAKELSQRLGLIMVNSGSMYRAVTWKLLSLQVDPADGEAVAAALADMKIECGVDEDRLSSIVIDGFQPGRSELKSDEVNAAVSLAAAHPVVRERLLTLQRNYLTVGDLVMEGRDIGSVIFPETPFKFYIDASEEVRNARRSAEGLTDSLGERDKRDSQRKSSPLVISDDACVIDSTHLTIDEVVEQALKKITEQGWKK